MHHELPALFFMWTAMMVAMMTPLELPALVRLRSPRFLIGYLSPWVGFSFAAAGLQLWLMRFGFVDHVSMSLSNPLLGAALLIGAGLLQFSPMKRACLERCRALAEPSLRAGVLRGLHSIGSCGVLMLVLFAFGVMSWPAMIVLTALLLVEHWLPRGYAMTNAAGYALLAAGILEAI
jgi:predicted metal-binding membrane protein